MKEIRCLHPFLSFYLQFFHFQNAFSRSDIKALLIFTAIKPSIFSLRNISGTVLFTKKRLYFLFFYFPKEKSILSCLSRYFRIQNLKSFSIRKNAHRTGPRGISPAQPFQKGGIPVPIDKAVFLLNNLGVRRPAFLLQNAMYCSLRNPLERPHNTASGKRCQFQK